MDRDTWSRTGSAPSPGLEDGPRTRGRTAACRAGARDRTAVPAGTRSRIVCGTAVRGRSASGVGARGRTVIRTVTAGLLTALLVALPAAAADAQSPRDRLLVTPDQLAARLDDEDVVVLHVGPRDAYPAEHIPGARFVSLLDVSAPVDASSGGLDTELPEPEALRRSLERLGISDDSRIVVSFAGRWVTTAARVVYTLDWYGLGDRTALLDGGLDAWTAAGHPVTDAAAPVTRGSLSPRQPRREIVVDAAWVHEHLDADGYRILDARPRAFYDAVQATRRHVPAPDGEMRMVDVRKGHIPGAASLPVTELVDESVRLRSATELETLFREAGVEPGQTVVAYCHLGQFATLVLLGARTLGYDVVLYDGSFQDWGSRTELPVEGPAGRRGR